MMTQEQVFRVLGKWQEENTLLHVVARFPDCTMGLDCRIMGFYERSIGFKATRNMTPLRFSPLDFVLITPNRKT
jgi:hypothetical protein